MNIALFFDSIGRDLRYALRGLTRRPAFTFAAVLTLVLGISATTAIFSVVYSVLIKPLPYPNPDELVRLRHSTPGLGADDSDSGAEPTMYLTYRDETRAFASVGLWQEEDATLIYSGEPERVRALRVTDGTLQALGVQPLLGRLFREQELTTAAEAPAPVMLSHAFWQWRFGGDESVIGGQLSIDSLPSQVVGIMPPDFRFLDMTPQPDVILAVRLDPPAQQMYSGNFNFETLARLKPGVTLAEAQTDAERAMAIWPEAWPLPPDVGATREMVRSWRVTPIVRPLKDDLVGGIASTLWVFMGAIGCVLLVACANIANLMLVRADARRHEFAVRAALGAVPARIARELLVESLCIGAAGSVLGLMLAYVAVQGLTAIGPPDLPRLQEITVYPPVLAFTVVLSLASALVFGTITACKHARHIGPPLGGAARGATASRERNTARNGLVVVQVALALVLVVSAALMIRTFQALHDVDPGFSDPENIQTARIWIQFDQFYPDVEQSTRREHGVLDRIAALPGVASVGFASALPMEGRFPNSPIVVEGQTLSGEDPPTSRRNKFVSPGYFEAMGTRIIAGRDLTWADIESGRPVAIVSEDFARELAPEPAGALGKRIRTYAETDAWREVIGVVESVHETGLNEDPPSFVYWPLLVEDMYGSPVIGQPFGTFAIRSERAGTASLAAEVRQAIRSVIAGTPIGLEGTMRDLYAGSLARTSFALVLLGTAGGMALLLGIVGIYGVIAYVVSQRAREIGIRSALGAEPRQLEKLFLLQGLALCGAGLVVGLVVAVSLGRVMSSLLFGVKPTDPAAYVAATGIILAAAALASYVPARRAATIDPMKTLRVE